MNMKVRKADGRKAGIGAMMIDLELVWDFIELKIKSQTSSKYPILQYDDRFCN